MTSLVRGYGRALVAVFFTSVLLWALLLIILPQLTMLERALTTPQRQLDSSVVLRLVDDAKTCGSILESYAEDTTDAAPSGGLAVPSMSGIAIPSASGPSNANQRPAIIQCERSTTRQQLVRRADDGPTLWLDEVYDLPRLAVSSDQPPATQIEQAAEVAKVSEAVLSQIRDAEAQRSMYTFENFGQLSAARLIPMSAEQRAIEDARLSKQAFGWLGLRFEKDGEVYERLGLITLVRTLFFALLATAIALVLCYPVAFKVALASGRQQAVWLFLGLVIPYTIAELMRIYAWTIIIDNRGLINSASLR